MRKINNKGLSQVVGEILMLGIVIVLLLAIFLSVQHFTVQQNYDIDIWNKYTTPPVIPDDGRDGRDGRDGADGRDGTDGRDGQDGQDGQTPGLRTPVCVSFIYPFENVDDVTSRWSTNNAMTILMFSSWSLLRGKAHIYAEREQLPILTHRGTRGLGVFGSGPDEWDEIDSYQSVESIRITFDVKFILTGIEVRSLFANDAGWHGTEEGQVQLFLDGSMVYSYHLVGIDDFYASGTHGVLAINIPDTEVDELVFFIPEDNDYTSESEFAVAKINGIMVE